MTKVKINPNSLVLGIEKCTVSDFWAWAYSDILSNRNRSIFAEFLVAFALDVTNEPRVEWDAVDIQYGNIAIEVKSAAYVQGWEQRQYSTIRFDISKKRSWNAKTNEYSLGPSCYSDCYVFCVYVQTENVNILDINGWRFYVVPTTTINEVFGEQKSIALNRLKEISKERNYEEKNRKSDLIYS